ncbi:MULTISPECIES: response regulator [unclassified Rhizobium]|uniref:response regulator n=1 Tax=unclassified Rhizobium TaxID=2613769 RepID=UPI001ADC9C29|nr:MULTISPECIES: response regulator [unclassified Rhizobium]MBO9124069.1 response regulator [Rhizobium sp. 16-488-2b]MBO9174601.1 response regulator [Rhizobium sp. 16-488-2a]
MKLGDVLVLENEPFIALDMEDMLRGYGASSVTSFDTQAEALIWLASNKPQVAVVDPRLNDGLCIDVVAALSDANVPFVVYSGAEVDDEARHAFDKGMWLGKPAVPELLEETLARLLATD